jgi:hypothetical protein
MGRGMAAIVVGLVLAQAPAAPARAQEEGGSRLGVVLRSVAFPGWGQIHEGRFLHGAVFSGLTVAALTGLVVADVNYDRSVERLDSAILRYRNAGSADQALVDFRSLPGLYDEADGRYNWRKGFLYAAIGVWALNLVDVLLLAPPEEEPFLSRADDAGPRLAVMPARDGWRIGASFSF